MAVCLLKKSVELSQLALSIEQYDYKDEQKTNESENDTEDQSELLLGWLELVLKFDGRVACQTNYRNKVISVSLCNKSIAAIHGSDIHYGLCIIS